VHKSGRKTSIIIIIVDIVMMMIIIIIIKHTSLSRAILEKPKVFLFLIEAAA
jgi:hypothetical protein